tara:strand:- start:266 stop:472 length:207 start_codon:yes stop_codon:yes gene_type:complete
MIVIVDEMVYLTNSDVEEDAAKEVAEHLDLEVAEGIEGWLIADEQVIFRRTTKHTYHVRCLGPTLWNT